MSTLFPHNSDAQVNFTVQTTGKSAFFKITNKGQGYENYWWTFGDNQEKYPYYRDTITHTYDSIGSYKVCVIGIPMPVASPDTICKQVNLIVNSIDKDVFEENEIEINIYKNYLQINNMQIESVIKIFDTNGLVVFNGTNNVNSILANTSDWPKGIYIVSIESSGERKRWKILKD